jgi:hypothetical protein
MGRAWAQKCVQYSSVFQTARLAPEDGGPFFCSRGLWLLAHAGAVLNQQEIHPGDVTTRWRREYLDQLRYQDHRVRWFED